MVVARTEFCWEATEQEQDEMLHNFQTMKMDMGQKVGKKRGWMTKCQSESERRKRRFFADFSHGM